MLFFVTLPNGSIIDIDLDSTDKVRDIILIMDKSDKILSLGLIDNFHLWYQSDTGHKINLMEDLNRTIGECGITLESKIYMQVKYTNLLEIAMKNRLIPDFENKVEKIQKRFRGNQVRKALREDYPEFYEKKQNSVPWLDDSTLSLSRKSDLVHTLQNNLDNEELRKHKLLGNKKSVAKKIGKANLMKVYSLYSTKKEGGGKSKKHKKSVNKNTKINRKRGKSKKPKKK